MGGCQEVTNPPIHCPRPRVEVDCFPIFRCAPQAASQTGVSFLVYFYEPRDERLCAWLVAKGAVHFRYVRELKALLDCVRQCEQASQVEAGGTLRSLLAGEAVGGGGSNGGDGSCQP